MGKLEYAIEEGEHIVRQLPVAGLHERADDLAADVQALRDDGWLGVYRRQLAR
jgi:hypothetical protein